MNRVLANGLEDQVELYQRLKKMIFYAALVKTQHYKVRIKGVAPFPTCRCSSY